MTNNHVVEGHRTGDLTFVDGNLYTAQAVRIDSSSDLQYYEPQIISQNCSSTNRKLIPSASRTEVTALGDPFGPGDMKTTGIVTQLARQLPN